MSGISNCKDASSLENEVFEKIEPLARRIVRWRLASTASSQDQEDVVGDVLLELISRLNSPGPRDPIADWPAYAAVTAHHGCDRYLRQRFPRRHRLSTRLRYLLETSRDYAIWELDSSWVCGYAEGRGSAVNATLEPGWIKQVPLPSGANESIAVASILRQAGGVIWFADLVEAVATLLDIRDQAPPSEVSSIAAREEDLGKRIDQRRALERLWREIAMLPRSQRVALLLNLRDEEGACALTSLPATGVASLRQIAAVVELPAEELAQLWGKLPLSDLEIAERLGLSRQQIINLRKSARQRLARRMTGNKVLEPSSKELDGEVDR